MVSTLSVEKSAGFLQTALLLALTTFCLPGTSGGAASSEGPQRPSAVSLQPLPVPGFDVDIMIFLHQNTAS